MTGLLINIQLNDIVADEIHGPDKKVSNRDPLRATMTIHSARPYLNLLSFNVNLNSQSEKVETHNRNLDPQPDLWFQILHYKIKSATTCSQQPIIKTYLDFDADKFQIESTNYTTINTIEVCTCKMVYKGLVIIFALCHKLRELSNVHNKGRY